MKNIIVSQWMSPAQYNVLSLCKRGEESAAFQEIERRLIDNIQKCPTTYQQDGLGDNAIVFLHYFNSNNDYYIFETDVGCKDNSPNQFQSQMMALKKEGNNDFRYGYIGLSTLLRMGCELDFYFKPQKIADIKQNN